jgi:MFS family permease
VSYVCAHFHLQGALVGPALAPVVAGVLTAYAKGPAGGWRAVQWLLAGMGAVALGAALLLPETIHVRGVDRLTAESDTGTRRRFVWVWVNPLRAVNLLRYPNVLAIVRMG